MGSATRWLWWFGVVCSVVFVGSLAMEFLGATEASLVIAFIGAAGVASMLIAGVLS